MDSTSVFKSMYHYIPASTNDYQVTPFTEADQICWELGDKIEGKGYEPSYIDEANEQIQTLTTAIYSTNKDPELVHNKLPE